MDADLLEQFVETTGSTMAEAMKYLKLCDNDINAAVGCYFDPTVVSQSHLINFQLSYRTIQLLGKYSSQCTDIMLGRLP